MNEKYPLALPEGTVLAGQYIVERVLGQGGFGITYEAKDHKTGERVAVKEFFPDAMATRTDQTTVMPFSGEKGENYVYGRTCFLQEAETLAKFIGNENIVRIHSYFEENGTAYFVMDFIEGTSFDEYLKEKGGKVSYEEAAEILIPVMDALSVVHSKGIVHRDVTPDNIYITNEGVVKLLDFGAARYSLGDQSRSLDIILKHGFAPKEQYTRRGKQGPYTDIYALGATFYFALTGKRPPDSVERMDEDDLVPPSSLGVRLSAPAENAILKALSVQPADRFQDMMSFKGALLNSQPSLAAVGSQPAVVQTYFTAPDQSSIPRSGPAAGPAPAPGQDNDLQDLAATMKTAGKLASRLAGKMAGKMAEKTAETAGIMAGTAGKMSEIMAAKKAETAEKLAAKMAEREAEKAAKAAEEAARRAAEEAARQEAERAAAEAAQQAGMDAVGRTAEGSEAAPGEAPGGDTAERAVGSLSGGAAGTVSGSAPAKKGINKKILIPVAAAAVVLLGVFALKPGGGDKDPAPNKNGSSASTGTTINQPSTNQPSTGSQGGAPDKSTASSTKTPTGDLTVVGNRTGNIMCGGSIAPDSNGGYYWVAHDGHSIYSEYENKYIFKNEEGFFSDFSVDGESLYFRYDNMLLLYNSKTHSAEEIPYLSDFNGSAVRLFLTKDYYVVGNLNSDYTVTVYLVSRDNGQIFECCTALGSNMFTISNDGYLYYIGRENDVASDCMAIYRLNMSTLQLEKQLVYTTNSDLRIQCPVVAGDYLYAVSYSDSDKSVYSIIRIDRFNGYVDGTYPLCMWNVSTETNQIFLARVFLYLNVHEKTHDMYFSLSTASSDTPYCLYKIKGYDDGSFDLDPLSERSYGPNIIYNKDGSFQLNYMSYDEKNDAYMLHYRDYDKKGKPIKNNNN